MRTRTLPSSVTLLFATLVFASCLLSANPTREPAPRFHATTTGGEKFTNESIKGKIVLFEFWATWCGYCDHEAPYVDQIAKEFAGKGLIVLAVDVGESKKTVKRYLEVHPRGVPIVMMEDTNLAAMYQANVYPIYVLIDRDGTIAGTQRGAAGEQALRRLLMRTGLGGSNNDSDDE